MHILNVSIRYIIGGNPQVCLDYSRMLASLGNTVTSVVNKNDPFVEQHKLAGANVIKAKLTGGLGPYDYFTILYFKQIIRKIKPDVIIIHEGRLTNLMTKAVGKELIPVIDVNHCRSHKQSKYTDATIVTNTVRMDEYKKAFGKERPLYYISNALDGKESLANVSTARNETPVIGVMSRFVHDKGIDIFIDALSLLNKRGVGFQAKIAGDGEKRSDLERQVKLNNLQDRVFMPGYEKDIASFYRSIDIFCLPSRYEEFGLVVLWAFKYGVPSVLASTAGPLDVAENDKDALVVPVEDPHKLADALQELIEDKKKAKLIAKAAYQKFINTYTTEVVAKNLNDILIDVKKRVCI